MKNPAFRSLIVAAALLSSADAFAATSVVTANISFDTPLTLTSVSQINFGTVAAKTNATYTISTTGAVTTTTGNWLYGTKSAGSINIAGSTKDTINISVSGYTAQGGVTPAKATCSYAGGTAASCDNTQITGAAPGTGKILLIGLDAQVDGTQAAGATATPSVVVTVAYN